MKLKNILLGSALSLAIIAGVSQVNAAAIHDAADCGDLEGVEEQLLNSVHVNVQNKYGYTALICCVYKGHTNIVEKLLQRPDIDVNARDKYGKTALMYASMKAHTNIVHRLLQHSDIKVNTQDNNGWTSLMHAAYRGMADIVDRLLQRPDIKVNTQDNHGWTSLMWAARKDHTEVVEKLLQHPGIQVNVQEDISGDTALMLAAKYERKNIITQLLQAMANVSIKNKDDKTALDLANDDTKQIIYKFINQQERIQESINQRFNKVKSARKGHVNSDS